MHEQEVEQDLYQMIVDCFEMDENRIISAVRFSIVCRKQYFGD